MDSYEIAWKVIGAVLILVLFAIAITLSKRKPILIDAPPEPNVCKVCGFHEATAYWPVIQRSWLDSDATGHRKLHGQSPMFVIRDNDCGPLNLCAAHKRLIERQWEQIFSNVRSRRAQLEVEIECEISAWEDGQMLEWAQKMTRVSHDEKH